MSLEAALAFCLLFFICFLPFLVYSSPRQSYCLRNSKAFKIFAHIGLYYFIISSIFSVDLVLNVLTGDMEAIRAAVYDGDGQAAWMSKLPPIVRPPFTLFSLIFTIPWIMHFFAFLSLVSPSYGYKYFVIFMLVSLCGPVMSIVGADRSLIAYWMLGFVACYIHFRFYISRTHKKKIYLMGLIIVGLLSLYLVAMTASRFSSVMYEEDVSGPLGSAFEYFGQPIIDFAYIYDNFETPYPTLQTIFPGIYAFVLGFNMTPGEFGEMVSYATGLDLWVFYTFIGNILVTAGKIPTYFFCFFFSLLSFWLLKSRNIKGITYLFFYYLMSSELFLGAFVHFYANWARTLTVIFYIIFLQFMRLASKKPLIIT